MLPNARISYDFVIFISRPRRLDTTSDAHQWTKSSVGHSDDLLPLEKKKKFFSLFFNSLNFD
jgi:hypothetical protein